ncbi:hypothetical protein TNCT_129121 [Trichonephila clavata]|uniref:Reverse transcriptase domain-containing protein n=1 Tax=Trichonephila clavata TaxID=2740835 RepID=A0A8X6KUS3_TRICU|nr:hypothetical protein TNCT_129121 [Trichonephila clavata]
MIDGFQEKTHKNTIMVLLDLSVALNKVWRHKLVNIIHSTGISSNALIWVNNFLRKRSFKVKVNGSFSSTHYVKAGVIQGSGLSSLLFLLCMNTIDHHLSKDVKVACYADHIAVWHTHTNLETSQTALNACMHRIETWSKDLSSILFQIKPTFASSQSTKKFEASSILSSNSSARK